MATEEKGYVVNEAYRRFAEQNPEVLHKAAQILQTNSGWETLPTRFKALKAEFDNKLTEQVEKSRQLGKVPRINHLRREE